MKGKLNHVLVARSVSAVNYKGEAVVQVMNVGPMSVTLYKGTRITNFVPRHNVFLYAKNGTLVPDLRSGYE